MESRPLSLLELFAGEKQCVVPLFQRPYTWTKKHWQPFWDDLLECYRLESEGTSARPHFLGAVVTTPVSTVPVGVTKSLVIDGQQRLTTLAILLVVMRDLAEDSGIGPLRGRTQSYLVNEYESGLDRLKLRPTSEDLPAYRSLVEGDSAPDGNANVVKAYRFFERATRSVESDEGEAEPIDPQRLFDAIRNGLQAVLIALGDNDDPYVIFETLNHRGASLTEADLVRNTVLMRFPHDASSDSPQRLAYDELWKPIESNIAGGRTAADASSDLSEFFRHVTMMDGSQTSLSGIYTAVKRTFDGMNETELRDELKRVRDLSEVYAMLLRPAEVPTPLRHPLQSIRLMKLTLSYPLLLRLIADRRRGAIDEDELNRCVRAVESFLLRRVVCDVPSNQLKRLFSKFCRALPVGDRDPGQTDATLRRVMSEGSRGARWPDDKEFAEKIRTSPLYESKPVRINILLSGIERARGHKESVDPATATIEHVFPQKPSQPWIEDLGQNGFDEAVARRDCLGNLTLTGYNPELSNRPWSQKRGILSESHFELNRELAGHATWNAAAIDDRGAALADEACRLWPGPEAIARPDDVFVCHGPDASGRARIIDGQLTLLAGSRCRSRPVPSALDSVGRSHQQAIDDGYLEPDGDSFRVIRDMPFNSPSAAAIFVLGRSANGKVEWRNTRGDSFAEVVPGESS